MICLDLFCTHPHQISFHQSPHPPSLSHHYNHSNIINNLFVFSRIYTCLLQDHPCGWIPTLPGIKQDHPCGSVGTGAVAPERLADPIIWGITEGHTLLSRTFKWSN